MKISPSLLANLGMWADDQEYFVHQQESDLVRIVTNLISCGRRTWANWLVAHLLRREDTVLYATFANASGRYKGSGADYAAAAARWAAYAAYVSSGPPSQVANLYCNEAELNKNSLYCAAFDRIIWYGVGLVLGAVKE